MGLTRKIKVLHIGRNTPKNGNTLFLLSLYRRICEDFTFIFIDTSFHPSDTEIDGEISHLGGKIYHLPCNSISEIEDKLKNKILEERPDILHSHYFFSNGHCMRIAFECDIPVRISHCYNDKNGYTDNIVKRIQEYYELGNKLGNAYIRMAKEYMLGSTNRYVNKIKVVENMKQAHELGNIMGSFYYALQFFEGYGVDKDIFFAEKIVKEVTEDIEGETLKGESEYLTVLADMYSFGLGKQQSFEKAFFYYLKAAELGNTEAMCDLGYMYSVGQGVDEDQKKSFEWYKKSADAGYLHSIRDLGVCYYKGLGISQNFKEAVRWFRKASKQNYAHATCDLALCYLKGNGVKKNLTQAAKCYLLAMKQEKSRAVRDVIAHCIDIRELRDNCRIRFILRDSLNIVDENILPDDTVYVNEHIKSVDASIFYDYTNIVKFSVENESKNYKACSDVLYSKDGYILVRFPLGSPITEFIVPDHVKYIGAHAFQNSRNLTIVKLHNGILSIGDSAFDDCKNMLEIVLPSSVKKIGTWAFHGCDKLEKIFIPENVEEIGLYAFGSCNNLREITVNENNPIVSAFDGNLYTKNFSVILQYAIGKCERIFALSASVKKISFRAFSDASNLEYVDASSVDEIEKKAFYYCTSLKNILLSPDCKIIGDNVFGHTAEGFKITHGRNGRILLASDIHGYLRLEFFAKKIAEFIPAMNDIIVILGDAGIVWQSPMRDEIYKFYSELPCNVLFLDGNHENFDLLNKFPVIQRYGGMVHEILPNVFHFMRGNAYIINGKKVFVFGGAYSLKREDNSSPITTWDEELPNKTEYMTGLKTLADNGNRFDYILTHQAPKRVLDKIEHYHAPAENELVDYLEKICTEAEYSRWFFGHLHKDFRQDRFVSLYENTEVI